MRALAIAALVFAPVVLGACDDEVIPPKVPQKQAVKEATPAERRDAACKAKTLPQPTPVKTGEGAPEMPQGNVARVEIDGASDDAKARAAIGISAFSNVLRSWRDGGPIGIHGTNETFSIGQPVSHGCIRLPNDVIIRLFAVTPLGTPVVIQP